MSKQAKRLGRGLESLISPEGGSSTLPTEIASLEGHGSGSVDRAIEVTVRPGGVEALLVRPESLEANPFQPRGSMDAESVLRMAESLKQAGMLQPIVARRVGAGGLQIVAGERRWRGAMAAKIERVPVLIREATDEQMLEIALIENIQREDLNPIDRARAYRRFCDEFRLSAEDVGVRVGEDRSTVTNYLRLLELPGEVKELVSSGDISGGHARCLLGIERVERQVELARAAVRNRLSVRALEEVVRREKTARARASDVPVTQPGRSPHVLQMELRFELAIGSKVMIKPSARKGRGKIIIQYNSLDDFDRVAAALGVSGESD